MALGADLLETRFNDLRRGALPAPRAISIDSIAVLFELSLGISAWKSHGGTSWALRCNPSSGNLHPTEGYLVAGRMPGLEAGVYHYRSRDHVLERRGTWQSLYHFTAGGALEDTRLSTLPAYDFTRACPAASRIT